MAKRFAQQLATLMVFFLVAPTVVLGQEQRTAAQDLEDKLAGLIHRIGATSGSDAASMDRRKSEAGFRRNLLLIALALTARTDKMRAEVLSKKHFQDVEAVRVDEQVGGSDANSGSTSLVSKGGIPTILGLAVENGALMRSESGTTITFRGNPVGIVEAFRKQGFSDSLQDLPETAFLRRLSFAFSFDTSRGDSAGMLIGDRQQLSSYSFRYEILNRRDPRHPAYKSRWEALTATKAQTVTDQLSKLVPFLLQDGTLSNWDQGASEAIANASADSLEKVVRAQYAELQTLQLSSEIEGIIESFARAYDSFLDDRNQVLSIANKGLLVTFEYTNIREIEAPDLSNFKLIAEGSLYNGRIDLTANGSLTLSHSTPEGSGLRRVRDFQFSGQLDIPLGPVQKVGSFVLSFSGKYERMRNDAMMNGLTMPDTKGNIGIGQIKLTIPVKGSGVKIPLSITFANRTELIKEKEVRGNIGMTFDLDAIFARLNP